MGITYFRKKDDEDEDEEEGVTRTTPEEEEEEEDENKRKKSKFLGLIPAVGSIVLFILTEDMRNPMRLMDKWTIWMAVIMVVNFILAFVTRNKKKEDEEEEEAKA